VNDIDDSASGHPWLRFNRVLCVMLHTRGSAEAWPQVKAEFKKELALRSQIRREWWVQLARTSMPSRLGSVCGAALVVSQLQIQAGSVIVAAALLGLCGCQGR
jgi:hypothetical protein